MHNSKLWIILLQYACFLIPFLVVSVQACIEIQQDVELDSRWGNYFRRHVDFLSDTDLLELLMQWIEEGNSPPQFGNAKCY